MNKIEKTAVCIIGAGPSGTATSIMLTKLKIPHYIIDKSTFPRDKTCGDGLILYAYKAMKLLGEDLFISFLKNPKFIHSKKISLHINNTSNIEAMIERSISSNEYKLVMNIDDKKGTKRKIKLS